MLYIVYVLTSVIITKCSNLKFCGFRTNKVVICFKYQNCRLDLKITVCIDSLPNQKLGL